MGKMMDPSEEGLLFFYNSTVTAGELPVAQTFDN